jgi:hypothetical protein
MRSGPRDRPAPDRGYGCPAREGRPHRPAPRRPGGPNPWCRRVLRRGLSRPVPLLPGGRVRTFVARPREELAVQWIARRPARASRSGGPLRPGGSRPSGCDRDSGTRRPYPCWTPGTAASRRRAAGRPSSARRGPRRGCRRPPSCARRLRAGSLRRARAGSVPWNAEPPVAGERPDCQAPCRVPCDDTQAGRRRSLATAPQGAPTARMRSTFRKRAR